MLLGRCYVSFTRRAGGGFDSTRTPPVGTARKLNMFMFLFGLSRWVSPWFYYGLRRSQFRALIHSGCNDR